MTMNKAKRRTKNVTNSLDVAIDRFIFHCRNKNLRKSTVGFYELKLHQFLDYLEEGRLSTNTSLIDKDTLEKFIAYCHGKNGPSLCYFSRFSWLYHRG